ncbi:MAG: hypothetical protein II454_03355 [Bacteroidales bacterium]|nr:hypothetical protein [Bacteroidales bacterium]
MKKILIVWLGVMLIFPSLNAQETRKYEIGADASFGFRKKSQENNNYSFSAFGGYKLNNSLSVGAGLNYTKYQSRSDVPSGIDDVYIIIQPYQAFRPFVYAHYDFLPSFRWTPYVDARLGYAFFSNSSISYGVNPFALTGPEGGIMYGLDTSEFDYLRDLDHSLGIKGNVYTSIGVGASLHLGKNKKGGKLNLGVSMDLQPVSFSYYNHPQEKKVNFSIGPKIGYTF